MSWTAGVWCAAYDAGRSAGRKRRQALHRELVKRRDVEEQRDRAEMLVTHWQSECVRLNGELRRVQEGGAYR
jgi:hypothetical protein